MRSRVRANRERAGIGAETLRESRQLREPGRGALSEQRHEIVPVAAAAQTPERLEDWHVCLALAVLLEALAATDQEIARRLGLLDEGAHERRLADPRPPGHEHHLAVARERLVKQKAQPDKLAVAADEQAPGQIGRPVRLPVGSRAPCRLAGGARRRRQLELGILLEDSTLEVAQPLRGLDAELVEAAAKLLIGAKSFGVAARAVEDEYLLGTQPLAKWVAGDERL